MALTQQELEDLAKKAEELRKIAEYEAQAAASIADAAEQAKALDQSYKSQLTELKNIVQAQEALAAQGIAGAQAEADRAKAQMASLQAQIDANQQILKLEEERTKYQELLSADADQILTSYAGITGKTKQFSEQLKSAGGFTNLLRDRAKEVKNQVSAIGGKAIALNIALNIGKDIMKAIGGAAMEVAKITAEPVKNAMNFENALKQGRDEIDQFRLTARDLQILDPGGIEAFRKSSQELAKTFRGTQEDVRNINTQLFQTSAAFRELKAANDPATDSLIKTSFLLERRLNIPISETAKITETLSQAFGKNAKEAEGFATSLAVAADNLGLDVRQTFADFQSQANNLAKFGLPDLQGEFLKLSKIQQQTGISIDGMLGALENFSTFEGALTAASKLNAVFGTTIDGLELMDTFNIDGPVEGFIKLREQLEASGLQIDQLNFSQMRALTSSIGMSAEQMRKFGNVSSEELRNITAGSMSAEEAMTKLQEAQGEGETLAEQQKKATDALVVAMEAMVKASHAQTEAMLQMAEQSPKTASAIEKFLKPAASIVGAVAGGALGSFFGPVGTMIGASIGSQLAGDLAASFAPGDNFISKSTVARVGEVGTENIARATQIPQTVSSTTGMTTVLNPGDSVQRMATTGGGSTNLTINLVGSDGNIIDSTTQTIANDDPRKSVSHYLNSKVSLLNS